MDIFRSEQSLIKKRIDELLPELDDIGVSGAFIGKKLHEVKNALKHRKSEGYQFYGSQKSFEETILTLEEIKMELTGYAEDCSNVIENLTRILNEIRYLLDMPVLL